MKFTCLQCERISSNPNLYCQETYCPAEQSPVLLDYGEWIGDIEIVKIVTVLNTSVIYEAVHLDEKVYLKVAHPGQEHTERLKREAIFLQNHQHIMLPRLRPAYAGTTIAKDPYGKTMLGQHLFYFYLLDYWHGEPLRDVLTKNRQLWINHIGWITIGLAEVINLMHHSRHYHFGLTPEGILVHFDDDEVRTPRILLVDLGIAATDRDLGAHWYRFLSPPAYTAPELFVPTLTNAHYGYSTDVYGVGLILYEMLIGESAIDYAFQDEEYIHYLVGNALINPMTRQEDVTDVANIARHAVSQQVQQRQPDVATLAQQLIRLFGHIPERRKKRAWPKTSTILLAVAAILALAFLITFAISLGELAA